MIQVLTGEKGSGKTKKLISIANELINQTKGNIVYISNNLDGIFDLNSKIRLIDTSQVPISNLDSFKGFIYGILAEDYDIESIVIDNLSNILKDNMNDVIEFCEFTKDVANSQGIKFILGVKCSSDKLSIDDAEYIAV
ncbi:hypothetical protein Q428_10490 [Fervidicella metallireducens AeB]|uniref:Twitching motility protein PilT n=1 Tax=Fervidicella metallireducens AeB TaxID=1403537 RepID=A0A017RTC1_9CLOT|nr:hypothetical protein [Fervidicella metallireducens]EYE87988.1 hypothetical protein Q428_10490 [Fervidicella metallireducens AeB]